MFFLHIEMNFGIIKEIIEGKCYFMTYNTKQLEETAVCNAMAAMCAAARTAPKTKGQDFIVTLALTGEEKQQVVEKLREMGTATFGEGGGWYGRDAANIENANGLVLIGVKNQCRGLTNCGLCGFENCAACSKAGGKCAYTFIDLGIALGSATSVAADLRIDNRIMASAGRGAMALELVEKDIVWQGIPVSLSGKSIFFDRK